MSRYGDFSADNRQTDKTDYFTPCAYGQDNNTRGFVHVILVHIMSCTDVHGVMSLITYAEVVLSPDSTPKMGKGCEYQQSFLAF